MGPAKIPLRSAEGEDHAKSRSSEEHTRRFTQVRAARMRKTLLLFFVYYESSWTRAQERYSTEQLPATLGWSALCLTPFTVAFGPPFILKEVTNSGYREVK
jgi:hypothetical protein